MNFQAKALMRYRAGEPNHYAILSVDDKLTIILPFNPPPNSHEPPRGVTPTLFLPLSLLQWGSPEIHEGARGEGSQREDYKCGFVH